MNKQKLKKQILMCFDSKDFKEHFNKEIRKLLQDGYIYEIKPNEFRWLGCEDEWD